MPKDTELMKSPFNRIEAHVKHPDDIIQASPVLEMDENHILMDASGKDFRRLEGIYLGQDEGYPVAALYLMTVMDQNTKRMTYNDVEAIFNGGKSPSFSEGNHTFISSTDCAPLISFLNDAFGNNKPYYSARHLKDKKANPSREDVIDAVNKLEAEKQIGPNLARNVISLLENIRTPASQYKPITIDATGWTEKEDQRNESGLLSPPRMK